MSRDGKSQKADTSGIDIPAKWEKALGKPVEEARCIFVMGPVSAGKSTFCLLAANRALEAGRRPAILDTDSGQSNMGPPTTLGAARLRTRLDSWEELKSAEIYFLGATSPVRHLLEAATGTLVLARRMREAGADLLIVNTTGLVEGGIARALKAAKMALLEPTHLVSIAKGDETEGILAGVREREDIEVLRLKPSRRAKERDAQERRERRERQFGEYFAEAEELTLDLGETAIWGTMWKSGDPMEGTAKSFAGGVLGSKILWAEKRSRGAFLIVDGYGGRGAVQELRDSLGSETAVIDREKFRGLLVGLYDGRGRDIALGRLEEIDFAKRKIKLTAPLPAEAGVAALRLGYLRIGRDGKEIESLPATFWG